MKKSHYEVHVQSQFSAAHHLRGYPGNCETPHGHNWTVDAYIECDELNELGIGIDFLDVQSAIDNILKELDHNDLNTLESFQDQNPSSENVTKYVYRNLAEKLNAQGVKVKKVCVSETNNFGVSYWED